MLNKEEKRAYQKEYMKKRRSNKGLTETDKMLDLPVTPAEAPRSGVGRHLIMMEADYIYHKHPAIMDWLTDPIKRHKLELITASLKKHRVTDDVRFGCYGPTFTMVGDLLDITTN